MNKAERYTTVAQRELTAGLVREPIWEEAMAKAAGEQKVAQELYERRRVEQNLEMEIDHQGAVCTLQRQRELNDSLELGLWPKTALLAAGFLGTVGLALALLLMK